MLLTLSNIPLRTASFALEDRWLLWSRARLYADRLVLSGWGVWERYRREILLTEIDRITREGQHLTLHLDDGTDFSLVFRETKRWSKALRVHRRLSEDSE